MIRYASESDIADVNRIMRLVSSEINDIDVYYADDLDFIKEHITSRGFTLVVIFDEKIVGFLIVRIPNDSEDNLGNDIDLDCSLSEIIHMESVAVLPEHRGHGLQKKLFTTAEITASVQKFRYAMATVSPINKVSLDNMLSLGYQVMTTKEKYGSIRHIVAKPIASCAPNELAPLH